MPRVRFSLLGLVFVLVVFLVLSRAVSTVHADPDAEQDQGEAEDTDTHVQEYALAEDRGQVNTGDRNQHVRRRRRRGCGFLRFIARLIGV